MEDEVRFLPLDGATGFGRFPATKTSKSHATSVGSSRDGKKNEEGREEKIQKGSSGHTKSFGGVHDGLVEGHEDSQVNAHKDQPKKGLVGHKSPESNHNDQPGTNGHSATNNFPEPPPGHHRMVIVIPADEPSPDLCKTIISAMALGYPAPHIVNWGKDFNKVGSWFGGAHLGKVTGTLEYLEYMSRKDTNEDERLDDDDLVLMVDAYDIWFQLTPDILINRYYEANRQANKRLAKQWNGKGEMPMQQTIIAASQKKCLPVASTGANLHCDRLPKSPMREDLYGERTD